MALSVLKPKLLKEDTKCFIDQVLTCPSKEMIYDYMDHSFVHSKFLSRNLQRISHTLEEYVDMEEDFIAAFPEWEVFRRQSIDYLTEVIKELDDVHYNSNVAKTTACVGGIVSGVVGIGGAVAKGMGHSSGSPLQWIACVGNLVSAAIGTGAVFTEGSVSQKHINNVKRVLQRDRERFEAIQMFYAQSQHVKEAIEKVCQCNVIADVFQELLTVIPMVKMIHSTVVKQVEDVIQRIVKILINKNLSPEGIERVVILCISVFKNRALLDSVQKIYMTIQNSSNIMPLVTMSIKVPCEVKFLTRHISGSTTKSPNKKSATTKEAITYGLFQGVNVAVELFSLKLLIDDFQKGSVSEHSVMIRELRDHLKLELALVCNEYKKLRGNNN